MGFNDIQDLRSILFQQLRDLKSCKIEDIPSEVERSASMVKVSETIINSAKTETEYLRIANTLTPGIGTGFIRAESNQKQIEVSNEPDYP